jgi:UDP-glucose 4-epimerase
MANLLITGGCGFIGANLAPLLRSRGHAITIIDNFSRGSRDYLPEPESYRIIEGDICSATDMRKAAEGQDVLVHLAAYGSVVESVKSPLENFRINVEGTFNVLNVVRESSIRQVVFASTGGAIMGNAQPPVNEGTVPRPISPYGAGKLAGEGYCCAFANAYGLSVTALRFANVIGPVSWHKKGAITAFFKAIMAGKPIRIFGDGSASRDFLDVQDLCSGISAAVDRHLAGFNVFHLASGREVTVRELAGIACKAAGAVDHPILYEPKRAGEVDRNFATYDAAQRALGFAPTVSLEETMSRTWKWFETYSKTQARVND